MQGAPRTIQEIPGDRTHHKVLRPSPLAWQALCSALEVPIEVFSATAPTVKLGEEFDGTPLRISFHDHYYALGAHYNSIVAR